MQDFTRFGRSICVLLVLTTLLSSTDVKTRGPDSEVWTTHGPEGGRIMAIAIDPQNPATVYAGTSSAGLFKSTDGGTRWRPVNEGLTGQGVNALAIDPQTPATLYVGTNEGVSKSTDGGGVWRAIHNGLPEGRKSVNAMAIDPTSPSTVYVKFLDQNNVFKSLDGGETWQATAGTVGSIGALLIDPQAPSTLYAGGSGVLKSEDGGATWRAINSGLTNTVVRALVLDRATSTTLYAGTRGGVFKSTDGGNSWIPVNTGLSNLIVAALAIDPVVSTTLYAGTGSPNFDNTDGAIFKSIDGGSNWTVAAIGLTGADVPAIEIDPQSPDTLYAGTSVHGVFKSTNASEGWSAANAGLIATSVQAVAIDPAFPSIIYAGTTGGLFKTADAGQTWTEVNEGLTHLSILDLAIDPQTSTTVYTSTSGGGVFKTIDGGASWSAVNNGVTAVPLYLTRLAIDPQMPGTVYAAFGGLPPMIFKTTNGGQNWVRIAAPSGSETADLAIDPHSSTTLYAGTFRGLYKTTDGGATWSATALTGGRVFEVAVDPQAPTTLYAYELCCNLAGGGGHGQRIKKSIDGGATWSDITNGLPNLSVSDLAVDPQTSSTVYATTRRVSADNPGRVFRSTDGGSSWSDISAGITNLSVNAIAINPRAPDNLYAGTDGGVYAITLPPPHFTLTVTTSGLGRGTVTSNPPGIDCGADCSESYVDGTPVTLTATPALGSMFMGWNGCDAVSGAHCTVTVNADRSVSADFVGIPTTFLRFICDRTPWLPLCKET